MTARRTHRLEGLEPDNLLAFLALLGLLRSLEAAGLRPRAHWEGAPLRPVLGLAEAMTPDEVAESIVAGARTCAEAFRFANDSNFVFDAAKLVAVVEKHLQLDTRIAILSDSALSAFIVEGATLSKPKATGHFFERAPLDCLGGGQTDLFATLRDALKLSQRADCATEVAQSVFHPWSRAYNGRSLRWDQSDFRQHAYSAREPSTDHKRQQWGANLLATIGTSAVAGSAAIHANGIEFKSLGSRIAIAGGVEFSWPIWGCQASLSSIQALLAHPEISADHPDLSLLRHAAVRVVYRSQKIWPSKYAVFTRAEAV